MRDTYDDIFNQRGEQYHRAMNLFPFARRQEFELIIEDLNLQPGYVLCDMPSGGGYVRNFVATTDIQLISIESSEVFFNSCPEGVGHQRYLCSLDDLPLPQDSFNAVMSLAGLHHVDNRQNLYNEVYRVLKNNGAFCFADALAGSPTDRFLNVFVDQFCSLGHQGDFLDNQDIIACQQAGFAILKNRTIAYHWVFDSTRSMSDFCILLFGLDKAQPQEVLEGIDHYLGYQKVDGRCLMNWELNFVQCMKTA